MRDAHLASFAGVLYPVTAKLLLNSRGEVALVILTLNKAVAIINFALLSPLQVLRKVVVEASKRLSAVLLIFVVKGH
jgi:hypothetical protein